MDEFALGRKASVRPKILIDLFHVLIYLIFYWDVNEYTEMENDDFSQKVEALKSALKNCPPLHRLMDKAVAENWKTYHQTTAEEVERDGVVDRHGAVELLKKLQRAKLGHYVVGRRGHDTRFVWHYDPKRLLEGVRERNNQQLGGSLQIKDENKFDLKESISNMTTALPQSSRNTVMHKFMLRPDYEVALQLPADLAMKEVDRISAWLRTVPFG